MLFTNYLQFRLLEFNVGVRFIEPANLVRRGQFSESLGSVKAFPAPLNRGAHKGLHYLSLLQFLVFRDRESYGGNDEVYGRVEI